MLIDIVTIFPEVFNPYLNTSILRLAQEKGKLRVKVNNLRDYALDKHRKVDDRPFGGGPGMVLSVEPLARAILALRRKKRPGAACQVRIILLCPQGKTLNQKVALRLSGYKHLILLCGHYEGVDERVRRYLIDEEISIGDYILTGGELAAMVLSDTVVRILPGVLGHKEANAFESFSNNLLEYPQYTRPADFQGMKVPKILLSGDHKKIAQWRNAQAEKITQRKRPDLIPLT